MTGAPLFAVILFGLIVTSRGECVCNGIVSDPTPLPAASNVVTKLTAVLLRLQRGSPATPQRLAIVTGSMFEAYALSSRISLAPISDTCASLINPAVNVDDTAAYAAFAAMRLVFRNEPEKLVLLDGYVSQLGYDTRIVNSHVGAVIARAIAAKFMLSMPTPYQPPNAPSPAFDAACDSLQQSDKWQPQCVQSAHGEKCAPQQVMFTPFFNATYITSNRAVFNLIADIPAPPSFGGKLSDLPFTVGTNSFADQYLKVIEASASLNDYGKVLAEFFEPNVGLNLFNRALDEALQRGLNNTEAASLFFALGAAMRDALVTSVTIKLTYNTVRPVTVIQCAYSKQNVSAWSGPYGGVRALERNEPQEQLWRPYLQTPPFPGYISGHSAVAAAGTRVLGRFFKGERPEGANCHVTKAGMSRIEGRIEKGSDGYVGGVTDVANSGGGSVGFSPARDITICWRSWEEFSNLVATSRLVGGIHIGVDNQVGKDVGRKIGDGAYEFVFGGVSLKE
ncbi:unnamed protein product [Agarophyton chilense]